MNRHLLTEASKKFGVNLRPRTSDKAVGPCPLCGGDDRFVVWVFDNNGWCSRCGHSVYVGDDRQADAARAADSKQSRHRKSEVAKLSMATNSDWILYNEVALRSPEAMGEWEKHGMLVDDIRQYGLGFCDSLPVWDPNNGSTAMKPYTSRSLTIPVFRRGLLVDIRHRLLDCDSSFGKYRSHAAAIIPSAFGLDSVERHNCGSIVIVEGEKKTIIMRRLQRFTVGIPGIGLVEDLMEALTNRPHRERLVWALDPGTSHEAIKFAKYTGDMGYPSFVADFFMSPDDMLLRYGANVVSEVLAQARRIR